MFDRLRKYVVALSYLKFRQIAYQCIRFLKPISKPAKALSHRNIKLDHDIKFLSNSSVAVSNNLICIFDEPVYDLNKKKILTKPSFDYLYFFSFLYFDFIHHVNTATIVKNFFDDIGKLESSEYFYHPYVTSKRIINLIIYCSKSNIESMDENIYSSIINQIHKDASYLRTNIEFHIDGNHLLTNYASLAIYYKSFNEKVGDIYFKNFLEQFYIQFEKKIHYERSVSYTSQLLHESILVFQFYQPIIPYKALKMLESSILTLKSLDSLSNRLEFVDNIFEQSYATKEISNLYENVFNKNIEHREIVSPYVVCDYINIFNKNFSISLDGGTPSPSFQPGHSHDSTGGVEMSYKSIPVIISGGVSTYEGGSRRLEERSRFNYSKVISEGPFQDTWSSFRVSHRTTPVITYNDYKIHCSLKRGNKKFERKIILHDEELSIYDLSSGIGLMRSQFIISPFCEIYKKNDTSLIIKTKKFILVMRFSGSIMIDKKIIAAGYGIDKFVNVISCTSQNININTNIKEIKL